MFTGKVLICCYMIKHCFSRAKRNGLIVLNVSTYQDVLLTCFDLSEIKKNSVSSVMYYDRAGNVVLRQLGRCITSAWALYYVRAGVVLSENIHYSKDAADVTNSNG